jgi:uncharacterized protein YjbJ (UPF0337 family)
LKAGSQFLQAKKQRRKTMQKDVLAGEWKQLRGEVQRKWGKLTDQDLDQVQGDLQKLLGKIQERYGHAKERAQRELDELLQSRKAAKGR